MSTGNKLGWNFYYNLSQFFIMKINHPFSLDKEDPELHLKIMHILDDYFSKKDTAALINQKDHCDIIFEPPEQYVIKHIEKKEIHDADYVIFRIFNNENDVILDIGANWGYSVASMWAVGVRGKIISFEANQMNEKCLNSISKSFPDKYQYFIQGLSDCNKIISFAAPVYNGTIISALCTAKEDPSTYCMASNINDHIRLYSQSQERYFDFGLIRFQAFVTSLDEFLLKNATLVKDRSVSAIKIDVEGLEYEVLRGSSQLLIKDKPLILAEGANRAPGLNELMAGLGYLFAERQGDILVLNDGIGSQCNGFFIHAEKIPEYKLKALF